MNRAIVDTDILSDLLRGKNPRVQRRAAAYLAEHDRLTISALTVFEVVRARHQASQPDRAGEFLGWTRTTRVVALDDECARVAGEIAGALMRTGQTVGVADVLIAASAIVHQLTLVIGNVAHFDRMKPSGDFVHAKANPISSSGSSRAGSRARFNGVGEEERCASGSRAAPAVIVRSSTSNNGIDAGPAISV